MAVMIKNRILLLLLIVFSLIGCDMFTTDDKRLVGNILLINPHNQDVNGYRMVIYLGNINSNVIQEDVVNVKGNDTVLFVKCKNENADFVYYEVNHSKGEQINKTIRISSKYYTEMTESITIKYCFNDE